jgi:hypothetical protein
MNNKNVFRKDEWIVDIFIHVLLTITVLSIVFWIVLSKIETKSLKTEIENNIENSFSKFKPSNVTKEVLKKLDYQEMLKIYDGKPSRAVKDYNKSLLTLNVIVIIIIFISFLIICVVLKINCGKNVPVGKIILENIGLFILIGIIEVLFFIKIASKFIPVKPSYIIETLKNNIISKSSN